MCASSTCVAEIWTQDAGETEHLKSLFSPLLRSVDPLMNLLRFRTNPLVDHYMLNKDHANCNGNEDSDTHGLATPSLAFVLLLREKHSYDGCGGEESSQLHDDRISCPYNLNCVKGWNFHHKIELSSTGHSGGFHCVAKQEFYQPRSKQLKDRIHHFNIRRSGIKYSQSESHIPAKQTSINMVHALWAVCPVHYGNEQFRFTMFTNNLEDMAFFYETLMFHDNRKTNNASHAKPLYFRDNFRLYLLSKGHEVDIQFALKQSKQLRPFTTQASFLKFRINDIRGLEEVIGQTSRELCSQLSLVHDPDGNPVLLEDTSVQRQLSDSRMRVWSLLESLSYPIGTPIIPRHDDNSYHKNASPNPIKRSSQPVLNPRTDIHSCPSNLPHSGSSEDVSHPPLPQDVNIEQNMINEKVPLERPWCQSSDTDSEVVSISESSESCTSSGSCWSDISSENDSGILSFRDLSEDGQQCSNCAYHNSCCNSTNMHNGYTDCSCGSCFDLTSKPTKEFHFHDYCSSFLHSSFRFRNTDSGRHLKTSSVPTDVNMMNSTKFNIRSKRNTAKQILRKPLQTQCCIPSRNSNNEPLGMRLLSSDGDSVSHVSSLSNFSLSSVSTMKSDLVTSDLESSETESVRTSPNMLLIHSTKCKNIALDRKTKNMTEMKPWDLDEKEAKTWLSSQLSS